MWSRWNTLRRTNGTMSLSDGCTRSSSQWNRAETIGHQCECVLGASFSYLLVRHATLSSWLNCLDRISGSQYLKTSTTHRQHITNTSPTHSRHITNIYVSISINLKHTHRHTYDTPWATGQLDLLWVFVIYDFESFADFGADSVPRRQIGTLNVAWLFTMRIA